MSDEESGAVRLLDSGAAKSLFMTVLSELGDKTFFIAAVMAMRYSRLKVFIGALSAMAFMTILSCFLGAIAESVMPSAYTKMIAAVLFLGFGVHTLLATLSPETLSYVSAIATMRASSPAVEVAETDPRREDEKKDDDAAEEEEVMDGPQSTSPRPAMSAMEEELRAAEREVAVRSVAAGGAHGWTAALVGLCGDSIVIESFAMSFFAEWGDRSQIATIGLAASNSIVGVTVGGILGHALCTGLAVIGGRHIAKYVSEHTLGITGGCLFLLFGLQAILL